MLQYDVVCDQEWMWSTAQSAFFVGGVIGSVAFGYISDRWGQTPQPSNLSLSVGNFDDEGLVDKWGENTVTRVGSISVAVS